MPDLSTLRSKIIAITLLASVGMASALWLLMRGNEQARESERWVHHTLSVIVQTKRLIADLHHADADKRAYIISGDARFLDRYRASKQQALDDLQTLRQLTRDNPSQGERLDRLERYMKEKLQAFDTLLRIRQDEGFEAALAAVRADPQRALLLDLHPLGDAVLDEERRLLKLRQARLEQAEQRERRLIYGLGIVLMLGVLALAFTLRRDLFQPIARLRDEALRLAGGDLAARVTPSGGAELAQLAEAFNQMATNFQRQTEKLTGIVDNMVEGLVVIDARGIVQSLNPAAERIFGHPEDALRGRNVSTLMPEPHRSAHDDYLRHYLQGGQARIIGIGREVEGLRADGSRFPMELSVAEVTAGGKRLFTGLVRDITERREAEDELLRATAEAERANRAKSEFLSRMSHELRTPLNAIVGFAQVLELEDLDPLSRESVEHILKAGRHLTDLINEILDIARIESGRQELSPEPVHLRSLLQDTWSLMRPLADQRHIQLEESLPEDCNAYVIADMQRFKQVLLNLMSNAIKYNHDGGRVTLACSEHSEGIMRVSVSDTGPGIVPADQKRIFEPFERLGAEQTETEGSGVGLTLSKALVEAMGGRLGLDSSPGEGTTVWVDLPTVDEVSKDEQARSETSSSNIIAAAQGLRPATVLYIEDNIANLRLMEVALGRAPQVELLPAMQGKLGLDLALAHKPDLILLDMHLADIPGQDVLVRLKANPETQHIPVVVISADATRGKIKRILAAGASDYLTKPFNIKHLLRILRRTLEDRTETK